MTGQEQLMKHKWIPAIASMLATALMALFVAGCGTLSSGGPAAGGNPPEVKP